MSSSQNSIWHMVSTQSVLILLSLRLYLNGGRPQASLLTKHVSICKKEIPACHSVQGDSGDQAVDPTDRK